MKTTALLSLFFLFCFSVRAAENTGMPGSQVTQEIRYTSGEATEVFIVWGVNNWNIPGIESRPQGSFVKDNLLYTPMEKEDGYFSAALNVKSGTMLDYVFWITRGPAEKPLDAWDLNKAPQKDYHTLALNSCAVMISPAVSARPKEAISILDYAIPLLSVPVILLFLFLILRTYTLGAAPVETSPYRVVIASALVLALALAFIRSSVTGQCWDLYLHPFKAFPEVLWTGFYDVLYVFLLTLIFLALLRITRNKKRISKLICGTFVILCFFSLLAGILNIRVVEMLGKPFNYPWLYYSDFLKSGDAQAAITSNIPFDYFLRIVMITVAAFITVQLILVVTDLLFRRKKMRTVLVFALACCSIVYIGVAPALVDNSGMDYNKLANPVVAFTASVGLFSGDPELFTMNVADSLKFDLSGKKNIPGAAQKKSIRNVLIFVMESTPAEYIQPYSRLYRITPELEKLLPEAVVFDNIYAHAPATNNSMVSILGSVYPWLSYNSITREHPGIAIPTISSELKKRGYRTAFFNSADNRFQKAGEFLAQRKFDDVKDCNSITCEGRFEIHDEKWDYLDGKDDACTADDLLSWVKQDTARPFFTMMWTYQTHYPYFTSGEEQTYTTADPVQNRYLNAVHHSDLVLGTLIRQLKESGLYESTLIVVIGDHGEAFGRHNQTTHASGIYEENLHVPCLLINPLFKGTHSSGIGGLVDIAPTVMDQLGFPSPAQWQGKDLFTAKDNDRVYFFTPWADYLFGYREGSRKYIFNATKNLTEMYDLKTDPQETRNIALEFPQQAEISHQRLAGWVQSINSCMNRLLAESPVDKK
jgi:phosphoglycerol transferase MdoB-like AlkP superfamily enzyme